LWLYIKVGELSDSQWFFYLTFYLECDTILWAQYPLKGTPMSQYTRENAPHAAWLTGDKYRLDGSLYRNPLGNVITMETMLLFLNRGSAKPT